MVATQKKGRRGKRSDPSSFIWGPEQDEAELVLRHAYAGGIAYDTETTGLTDRDEVTEIALVRICDGVKLFESRVRPHWARMSDQASRVTGITDRDLKKAPYWEDIEGELLAIIGDARLVAWSGERYGDRPFDSRLCEQSHIAAGLPPVLQPWMQTLNIKPYHRALRQKAYGMGLYSSIRGGLGRAVAIEGLEFTGAQHGALVDAVAVAAVVRACQRLEEEASVEGQQEPEAAEEV